MNVVFIDPIYIKSEAIQRIGDVFHITDVYNLMPMAFDNHSIKDIFGHKVKIWRKANETLDSVTKRAVYELLNKVSKPLIVDGVFIRNEVFDLYDKSRSDCFIDNIALDDPNILIFEPNRFGSDEKCETIFFQYFFNILKKYDKSNRYKKRISFARLLPFIDIFDRSLDELERTELWDSSDCKMELENNTQVLSLLLKEWGCVNTSDLRNKCLNSQGLRQYLELAKEIEVEVDYGDDVPYDDGLTEVQRWGAENELDYIRNNGGDWIDD